MISLRTSWNETMLKKCTHCKIEKQLEEFSKDLTKRLGLRGYCKPCDSKLACLRAAKSPELHKARCLAWHKANREKALASMKASYQNNIEVRKQQMRKWGKANRDVKNALHRKRECAKTRATPPWFNQEDYKNTLELYKIAKELRWLSNEPLHVDHIEPILGKDVCGLHVPWNLQILPASENSAKGNRRG